MTSEQQVTVDIKTAISQLRGSDQDIVNAYAHVFRSILKGDEGLAALAFALVGAELSAQA